MKNARQVLWKTVYVFTFLIGLSSCGDRNQKTEEEKPKEEHPSPPIVEVPANIISLEQADAIYANYSRYRVPVIENYEKKERAPSENFEVARFVDFDFDQLKNYIAFVDQEAKKAGVNKVTTLRMYFANYPNEEKFSDGKEVVHKRQNSIFITPTMAIDKENYSFYIGNDGKPKLIKDRKAKQEKGMGATEIKTETNRASLLPNFLLTTSTYNGQSLIYNRGNNGPPPHTEF